MTGHAANQFSGMGRRRPGSMGLRPAVQRRSNQSTAAVIERLGGRLSYRMLDYWIRIGRISLAVDARGSGSRRMFSAAEEAALVDTVNRLEEAEAVLADINSGDYFRRRVATYNAPASA